MIHQNFTLIEAGQFADLLQKIDDLALKIEQLKAPETNDPPLSRAEAQKFLGIGSNTLSALVRDGKLRPSLARGRQLFPMSELKRFLTEEKKR